MRPSQFPPPPLGEGQERLLCVTELARAAPAFARAELPGVGIVPLIDCGKNGAQHCGIGALSGGPGQAVVAHPAAFLRRIERSHDGSPRPERGALPVESEELFVAVKAGVSLHAGEDRLVKVMRRMKIVRAETKPLMPSRLDHYPPVCGRRFCPCPLHQVKSDDTAAFFGVRHITRRVPVLGASSTADLAGHTGSYPLRAISHQRRLACGHLAPPLPRRAGGLSCLQPEHRTCLCVYV